MHWPRLSVFKDTQEFAHAKARSPRRVEREVNLVFWPVPLSPTPHSQPPTPHPTKKPATRIDLGEVNRCGRLLRSTSIQFVRSMILLLRASVKNFFLAASSTHQRAGSTHQRPPLPSIHSNVCPEWACINSFEYDRRPREALCLMSVRFEPRPARVSDGAHSFNSAPRFLPD